MTILDMLGQSTVLMVLGMGVVFSFIVILIISLTLVHKLISFLKLDIEKAAAESVPSSSQDTAVVAAIAAAVRGKNA